MSTEISTIPVNGVNIHAMQDGAGYLVALKPVCDAVGVDYSRQLKKLRTKAWATVALMPTVGADLRQREMAMIDRRTFTMWLATIDTNRVSPDAAPVLEAFQNDAADALDAHFHGATAAAPPTELSRMDILTLAMESEQRAVQLEAKVAADAPKVEYVDTFVADNDLRLLRAVAKDLHIAEGVLRDDLLSRNWIYKESSTRWSEKKQEKEVVTRYSPYADKARYFQTTPVHDAPRFRGEVMHTLKVTPQGAAAIARLYRQAIAEVAA